MPIGATIDVPPTSWPAIYRRTVPEQMDGSSPIRARAFSDLLDSSLSAFWESAGPANLSPVSFGGAQMPAAYSYDLRERVVDTVEAGASRRRAADVFRVSVSTAIRWSKRVAETGTCAARPSGGDHKSRATEVHGAWLLALVAA